MDPMKLQLYLSLFAAAMAISQAAYNTVKGFAVQTLSADELVALEAAWESDVVESATNAGIAPEPDTPIV